MKTVLFISLISLSFLAHAQLKSQNRFILTGIVQDQQTGPVYLSYFNQEGLRILDSTQLISGKFSFEGSINSPTHALLHIQGLYDIFLEPTSISGIFPGRDIRGSETHQLFDKLNQEKRVIDAKYERDLSLLRGEEDKEKIDALRERLTPYFLETNHADYNFMTKHPQSSVTLYLLKFQKYQLTPDSLETYYQGLGERLQQTPDGKDLLVEIDKVRQGSVGKRAFVFISTDINGKPLSLSDYKGQYVLLDFWGSWCGPCRKGNPHLITLYQKYKPKRIEFIGVASDDKTPDAWRKAVDKDQIGIWKHLLLTEQPLGSASRKANIGSEYGINSYPTKILIDPQGLIIGRYSGSNERDLDVKLQEVFSKK